MSGLVYEEVRNVLRARLERVIEVACTYCEHDRVKTVTKEHVVRALRLGCGQTFYG